MRGDSTYIRYGLGFNPVNEEASGGMTPRSFVYEPHKAVSERLWYCSGGFFSTQHYYYHDHLGSARRPTVLSAGALQRCALCGITSHAQGKRQRKRKYKHKQHPPGYGRHRLNRLFHGNHAYYFEGRIARGVSYIIGYYIHVGAFFL